MSEVDPDPYEADRSNPELGGHEAPDAGDPTDGGKHGEIGAVPSITADEPDAGGDAYPVGGGSVEEEQDAPPVTGPGN